jgi:hypothetical protein
MKKTILFLSFLLIISVFLVFYLNTRVQEQSLKYIEYRNYTGEVIYKDYFSVGQEVHIDSIPEIPNKENYEFLHWSKDIPESMPNHSIVIYPVYVKTITIIRKTT